MIKVLHLVLNLNVGGLERFVIDLTEQYGKHVSSLIVCLEDSGELAELVDKTPIIAFNEKPGLKFKAILKIIKIVNDNKIQIIHTHNEAAHFYGSVAGLLSNVPVIHTRHGRYLHNSKKKIMLNVLSSYLTKINVGVSEDVSELMISREYLSREKVVTILNGVNVDNYILNSEISSYYDGLFDGNYIRIGIVARLDKVKDHSNLLSACRILKDNQYNFKLFIIGDGSLRNKLENEATNLGLCGEVRFAGTRNDIPEMLNGLDIYVLSSVSEGISLTLLEAMSSSLPAVATNVGGNPEVVVDGETGFLVPSGNSEALADKLMELIRNPALRDKMGKAGCQRVKQLFSLSQTAEKYEKAYAQLLKGKL